MEEVFKNLYYDNAVVVIDTSKGWIQFTRLTNGVLALDWPMNDDVRAKQGLKLRDILVEHEGYTEYTGDDSMPTPGTWAIHDSIFDFGFEPNYEAFETLAHRAISALGFTKGDDISMTVNYIWE
jgi:hypothetical protein